MHRHEPGTATIQAPATASDLIHRAYRHAVVLSRQNRPLVARPSVWPKTGWPAGDRRLLEQHPREVAADANAIPKLAEVGPQRAVRVAAMNLVRAVKDLAAWEPAHGAGRLTELRVAARVKLIELDEVLTEYPEPLDRLLAIAGGRPDRAPLGVRRPTYLPPNAKALELGWAGGPATEQVSTGDSVSALRHVNLPIGKTR